MPVTPKEIVQQFFNQVRSGLQPEDVHNYMAKQVLAHQMTAESETTVLRTPANYADHVREMIAAYRIENDRIVEYWIQIDREGIRAQLQRNA